jgi:hypothetical protein
LPDIVWEASAAVYFVLMQQWGRVPKELIVKPFCGGVWVIQKETKPKVFNTNSCSLAMEV